MAAPPPTPSPSTFFNSFLSSTIPHQCIIDFQTIKKMAIKGEGLQLQWGSPGSCQGRQEKSKKKEREKKRERERRERRERPPRLQPSAINLTLPSSSSVPPTSSELAVAEEAQTARCALGPKTTPTLELSSDAKVTTQTQFHCHI